MNNNTFSTLSTFGDIIYSLCLMKYLGGGELYVKLNALDDFCRNVIGWPDAARDHSGRLTEQDYYNIEPLLKAQDYFKKVAIWKGEEITYPHLDNHWQMHLIKGWQGNQTECYALCAGLNIHDPEVRKKILFEPWLTGINSVSISGKPIVVNRTSRYLGDQKNNLQNWNSFIKNGLPEYGVFVGSEQEHEMFEKATKIKIDYYKTKNLLELAQVIQGCEMFIGNQSAALSIAIGLGKTYWCEINPGYMSTKTPHGGYGDVWFPRINGFYF